LRTPLNAVLGWTLMLRGITDRARLDRGLDVIDRNGRALTRIIEDLLDFSRNARTGLRFEPAAIDLRDVAQQALASIEPLALQQDVGLSMVADNPCMVIGDPARLQQVAWNLLTNAVKFTPPGGSVTVAVISRPDHVEMQVSDTGPGIRPELLDVIFDPFRQGEAHGTPGLGLGLAIVRQIVEAHAGTVGAGNRPDRSGAVFTVRLTRSGR
jgi:signal transduction histidine kinase